MLRPGSEAVQKVRPHLPPKFRWDRSDKFRWDRSDSRSGVIVGGLTGERESRGGWVSREVKENNPMMGGRIRVSEWWGPQRRRGSYACTYNSRGEVHM